MDGSPYFATTISVQTLSGKLCISGMQGTSNLLIWLPATVVLGTFDFDLMGNYVGQYAPTTSNIFTSQSGSVTITDINTTNGNVKGTFHFVGTDFSTTINVLDGQFDIYK